MPHAPLEALTLDFWDTIYLGAVLPERKELRRTALRRLFADVGRPLNDGEFDDVWRASAAETDRLWREEHKGYQVDERVRWMLRRVGVERPVDCEHVGRAVRAMDEVLRRYPAPLLPGAAEGVRALAARFPLAVVSDTGFSSGLAQDEMLARDGLLDAFAARIYSCDCGFAKPRPEPFRGALDALGVRPAAALHVGDLERTDVLGALAVGMRAVRIDLVRASGPTAAEYVAHDWPSLVAHILAAAGESTADSAD